MSDDLRKAAYAALTYLDTKCAGQCGDEPNPCYERQLADALSAALAARDERVRELEAGLRLLVELSDEVMRTEWGSSPAAEQDLRKRCGQAYASARALLDPHATKEPT